MRRFGPVKSLGSAVNLSVLIDFSWSSGLPFCFLPVLSAVFLLSLSLVSLKAFSFNLLNYSKSAAKTSLNRKILNWTLRYPIRKLFSYSHSCFWRWPNKQTPNSKRKILYNYFTTTLIYVFLYLGTAIFRNTSQWVPLKLFGYNVLGINFKIKINWVSY